MMLKTHTEYALRALLYLAYTDGSASMLKIASVCAIPQAELNTVADQLALLGWIVSRSSTDPATRLAVHPSEIHCSEVVAAFEGRHGLLPSANDRRHHALEPGCALRRGLKAAEDAMYHVLKRLTIADLLRADSMTSQTGIYSLASQLSTACADPGQESPIENEP